MDMMTMMPVSHNASSVSSSSNNSMEMVTIDLENIKDCCICLSSISPNTGVTLDCNHTFHSACYNMFLVHELKIKETNTVLCPVCRECIIKIVRQTVDTDEDDYPMLYDATTERQEISVPSNDLNVLFIRYRMCFMIIQFGLIVMLIFFIASIISCSIGKNTSFC